MSNPEQSKSEFYPARLDSARQERIEKEPEEKTVYGSFNDAAEEYKQKIDSGEIDSKEELFSISEPVLLSQKGELFKRYFERQGYSAKEEEAAKTGYLKEQKGIAGALNLLFEFGGEELVAEWKVRRSRYPNIITALDFSSIFDKEKVKRLSQNDPYLGVHFFHHTGSEKFLDLLDKDVLGRYVKDDPSLAFQVFLYTRSERFLDLLDKEAVKKYSADNAGLALTIFQMTGSEKIRDLFDKEAIAGFSRERPELALSAYCGNPDDEFFNLLYKESFKKYLLDIPVKMYQICRRAASEK